MPTSEIPRLSRLMAIFTVLQSKRLVTSTELAEKFDVSIRTIYRDMRALEAAGIPVTTIEGRGYSLMSGYKLPPVMFTEAEANALITAEKMIKKTKDSSFIKDFSDAVQKIRAVLPEYKKEKIEFLTERIVIGKHTENVPGSRFLSVIQQALANFNPVQIEYKSAKDEITIRVIEPFVLYFSPNEEWILAAYCRLRKDFRAFRLDRIESLLLLGEKFEAHKLTIDEYVEKYVRNNFNP